MDSSDWVRLSISIWAFVCMCAHVCGICMEVHMYVNACQEDKVKSVCSPVSSLPVSLRQSFSEPRDDQMPRLGDMPTTGIFQSLLCSVSMTDLHIHVDFLCEG